jgi:Transcriptional regulator containing an amidase domain and an AraC-type DNA-binding HTH domain
VKAIRIGILGFDGIQALDLVGPSDAFTVATTASGERCYEVVVIGISAKPFRAESGVIFHPHETLRTASAVDTLIVPGGRGLRVERTNKQISQWIGSHAAQIRRIACVCTGTYGIAPTGLLNGREVTTHWRFAEDLQRRFPKLMVSGNALFLKDGRFYTSAGITAGIDLSLALIEEDFGPRVALRTARELVVYMKRTGGQEQFSEPLQFQITSADQFSELAAWILRNLDADLSLEVLAKRACLSGRHFSRRFKASFGGTPASFIEKLRLDEARRRLSARSQTIEQIAKSVGFNSDDAFRTAFERRFGVKPSSYRNGFHLDESIKQTKGKRRPEQRLQKGRTTQN